MSCMWPCLIPKQTNIRAIITDTAIINNHVDYYIREYYKCGQSETISPYHICESVAEGNFPSEIFSG